MHSHSDILISINHLLSALSLKLFDGMHALECIVMCFKKTEKGFLSFQVCFLVVGTQFFIPLNHYYIPGKA
jgi:hypothetical protein